MIGRTRRLKNFEARAESLRRDISSRTNVRSVKRDGKTVIVGTGKNRRLISKSNPEHMVYASEIVSGLKIFLLDKGMTPSYYKLEEAAFSPKQWVQEYFERPTVSELKRFFGQRPTRLGREEALICKRLVKKNPIITLEKVLRAFRELTHHISQFSSRNVADSNLVILGVTKNGKLRVVIIDS